MCGITGILQRQPDTESLAASIDRMRDALVHRGPDDRASWIDYSGGHVALGHRRLAVLDLSPLGAQPMHSVNGRYVLVFNGEIYNFRRLKEQLRRSGHAFRGGSDTEVVLAAFSEWGIEAALRVFEGMFALAVWDRAEQQLYLARDRFGEKPLYYGVHNGVLLFASELKAMAKHKRFDTTIDRGALTEFMRHAYIPGPQSIFLHYKKLPPGSFLRVGADLELDSPRRYFDLDKLACASPAPLPDEQAVDELERLLSASIADRMVADVPVGAFLSGGIDSSLIVSLMQAYTSRPIQTFTIGFDDASINEAEQARATAALLGTTHHEITVSDADLRAVMPALPEVYDEPLADPAQIPAIMLSRMARQHVTVALSGDGGDELLAGYHHYNDIGRHWRRHGGKTRWPNLQASLFDMKARFSPRKHAKYARQAAITRAAGDLPRFYRDTTSQWPNPEQVVLGGHENKTAFLRHAPAEATRDPQRWLQATDAGCYLPDDILVKVDRAAMAASLETRAPFLDTDLATFALGLPAAQQYRDGKPKWLARQLLYRYLPRETVERPKHGFEVPLRQWLRGPLCDWSDALLDSTRLRREGYFNADRIQAVWQKHRAGTYDASEQLWCVLMFQAWLESFLND
ncbi:asparagine synthase (glutamine-hydrolyzing) [uncultured Salinisphaera sp.]|uniref:asparagine synthase (glutamine-hydrolyzing) n=1 Tax=uncultured Salinisphaera sp. TaxID=359372 RepID=UPI0032B30DBF